MGPFTGISLILSLVQIYLHLKSDREKTSADNFLIWLEQRNLQEIRTGIEANRELLDGLEQVLAENHDDLVARLDRLEQMLTQVITGMAEFGGLRGAVPVQQRMSEQAREVLEWFVAQTGQYLFLPPSFPGPPITHINTENGSEILEVRDGRFIRDDLAILTNMGLLTCQPGTDGADSYRITRLAVDYVRQSTESCPD